MPREYESRVPFFSSNQAFWSEFYVKTISRKKAIFDIKPDRFQVKNDHIPPGKSIKIPSQKSTKGLYKNSISPLRKLIFLHSYIEFALKLYMH